MKIGIKIILPIFLILVIIIGVFGYIFYNLKQQEAVISTEGAKIRSLNGLNERLFRQQERTEYNVLAYRFSPDKALLLSIYQSEFDKSKTLDDMFPFITTSRGRELINNYIETRKEIEKLRNDLIGAIDYEDQEVIALTYNKWNIQNQNIKAALADIGAYNINSLEKTLIIAENTRNRIFAVVSILILVIIVTILAFFFYLRVVIVSPIIKLAQFADNIANKNFTTTTTTTTTRKDEVGMLERSFNVMAIKLKDSYMTLEQKVSDRTRDLNQEKAKDEAILASIGDGLAVADEKGKSTYFNKQAKSILGIPATGIAPDSSQKEYGVFDSLTLKPLTKEEMPLFLAVKGKEVIKLELFIRNSVVPNGRFIRVTATPIILEGRSIGGVAIFSDITKEKEIDRAKTEFVSLASHQLKTPPTAIKLLMERMLGGRLGKFTKGQQEYLHDISISNQRMIDLVNALLNVSRIELGEFSVQLHKKNVCTIVQNTLNELQPNFEKKQLKIEQVHPRGDIIALIDETLFRMIVMNLITNAINYSSDGDSIRVECQLVPKGKVFGGRELKEDSITITVADQGCGIPDYQQDKIFTKFFRADNIKDQHTDGTGLGLYIAKSILDNSGGLIWFSSKENQGTAFYVVIPMAGMKAKIGSKELTTLRH